MALQLTIACGDYDRTHPLIDGSIKPEGIELNWLVLPHLEIWTRMLNFYDFDASEISMSSYITSKSMGRPLIAIPVFPARAFRHSYIFINTKSGIREPKAEREIGVHSNARPAASTSASSPGRPTTCTPPTARAGQPSALNGNV